MLYSYTALIPTLGSDSYNKCYKNYWGREGVFKKNKSYYIEVLQNFKRHMSRRDMAF